MNILCTICDDLLNEDGDNSIFVTLCGHIFHRLCLFEWLDRASTCPQCRSIVSPSSVTRLYLTIANEKPVDETVKQLQSCLDNQEQLYRQQLEDLKLQKEMLDKMKQENEAQNQNIITLKAELERLKNSYDSKEQYSIALSTNIDWANVVMKSQKTIIADLQIKNNEKITEIEMLKVKNKDLMTENEALKIKNEDVMTENEALRIKEKNLKKDNQILEMNAQILNRKLHLATTNERSQQSVVVDLENKNETLKKTIETLNGKVQEVGENLRKKEWVIIDLVAQLTREGSKDKDLSKRIDKLRSSTQTPITELIYQTCDEPECPNEDIQNDRERETSDNSEQEGTVTADPNVSVSIDTPTLGDITTSEESSPVTEIDFLYNEIKNRLTFARTAK